MTSFLLWDNNNEEFRQNAIKAEQTYHEVLWMQKPVAIYLLIINVFGSLGNLSIIFLTFKSRHLHQSCNYLMALLCTSSFCHQLGLYTMSYIIFSEITYIPLVKCLYWQTLPLIGNMFGELLPFLIGIDRFLCFYFPMFHRKMNRRNFLAVNTTICSVYSFIIVFSAYVYANSHPNEAVNCGVIEALGGNVNYGHFLSCATINMLAVLCYVIVWAGLHTNRSIRESNKQIFKCMFIIMVTLFCGWFSVSALRIILISVLKVGTIEMFYMKLYGVIVINSTCASQSWVLFWFSRDYRQSFKGIFFCSKVHNSRMTTTVLNVKSKIPSKSYASY